MNVKNCSFLSLPHFADARGHLVFAEGGKDLPFAIARIFYMYGIPAGASRGAHAHRQLRLVLAALAGAADVLLDDGEAQATVRLDDPGRGLVVGQWVWHELANFAPGTVILALASGPFSEADYIRNHADFKREIAARAG